MFSFSKLTRASAQTWLYCGEQEIHREVIFIPPFQKFLSFARFLLT